MARGLLFMRFMIRTRPTWIFLVLLAVAGSARAFLPADRFAWWDAAPPPTGPYTEFDTIEAFFNEPIRHDVDFDAAGGWPDPQLLSVHRPGNKPGRLVRETVFENGMPKQRLVLELEGAPADPEDPGTMPGNAPALLDFATPQRAVLIQFGFRCPESVDCTSSSGQSGVDASGFELLALDDRGNPITSAHIPIAWDETVHEGRADYVIGLRDEAARIHRVELRLGYGNLGRGELIEGDLLIRRIVHEAFPHAAVKQIPVTVGTPLSLPLPYHFDAATAVTRGVNLTETTVYAMTGFEYRVDSVVANGQVTLTATGTTKTEISKTSTPVTSVYVSLIGWDKSQVELVVKDDRHSLTGEGLVHHDAWFTDPCRGNACGPAVGPTGWPTVVMSAGLLFDQIDPKGNNRWDVTVLDVHDNFERDLVNGQIRLFSGALVVRDDDWATYRLEARHRTLAGRSVVQRASELPSGLFVPGWDTQTSTFDPIIHYDTNHMEAMGYSCDIAAPVAAVGARFLYIDTTGADYDPSDLNRGLIPRAIDIQVKGQFTGDVLRSRVIGRVQSFGEGSDAPPDHLGQIFVVPSCIGLKAVRRDAVPIVTNARFASLKGLTAGPEERGKIFNLGPGNVTLTSAKFTGATAPFALEVHLNGRFVMPLANLRGRNSVLLRPGEYLEITGSFTPPADQQYNASIRFDTSLPGGQVIDMAVTGRIPATADWFPTPINFGLREVRSTATRNALLAVNDIVPVQIFRFEVQSDPEGNFNVIPDPAYSSPTQPGPVLHPGESTVVQVLFAPSTLGVKRAQIVAVTDVGDRKLDVMGEAVPPPAPLGELIPSVASFGLVPYGMSDEGSFTLTNHGFGVLEIRQPLVQAGDPSFEVLPPAAQWPARLGKDQSFSFRVRFNAAAPEGIKNGSLTIDTNDGPFVVVVSGFALAPQ